MRTTSIPRIAVAVAGLALLGAACSRSTSSSGPARPASTTTSAHSGPDSTATSTAAPAGVDPNAKEDNPPGDIPDDQVFVAYTPPSGAFTVKVPEGWARTENAGAVTFTDNLNRVRMEMVDAPSAPTVDSVRQNELPAIQAAAKRFEAGKVTMVTRKAGPAVLVTYRADADPNPVTGKVIHDDVERYEFWRNGKAAILTLSGPQGADNVDPWRIVTDSFGWK
jgi:hypothetical protein